MYNHVIKKVFVKYPGLRFTTNKYDPCIIYVKHPLPELNCNECRAFLISDRFLGDDFQTNVIGSKYKYGYCLIADTLDCNFRCWFCYSHHFWIEESERYRSKIEPYSLTPELVFPR